MATVLIWSKHNRFGIVFSVFQGNETLLTENVQTWTVSTTHNSYKNSTHAQSSFLRTHRQKPRLLSVERSEKTQYRTIERDGFRLHLVCPSRRSDGSCDMQKPTRYIKALRSQHNVHNVLNLFEVGPRLLIFLSLQFPISTFCYTGCASNIKNYLNNRLPSGRALEVSTQSLLLGRYRRVACF